MAKDIQSIPDLPIDLGERGVVLNITNGGIVPHKQRPFMGAFGRGLIFNLIASWVSSWVAYFVASYRIIPYIFVLGIWLCGGKGEMPPLPGTVTPEAVDPRFDQVQPQLDEMSRKIEKLEREIRDGRTSSAEEIKEIRAETDRLAATTRQAEENERQSSREASRYRRELEEAEALFRTNSRDIKWLEFALVNAELEKEIDVAGYHINAQCPRCHASFALKYPLKDDSVSCHKCMQRISAIEAWKLDVPRRWAWKREVMKPNPLLGPPNRGFQ